MDTDALRRLHYAAAIACGVFAALVHFPIDDKQVARLAKPA